MSKAVRQRSARERLAEERARQAAGAKRNRAIAITAVAMIVLAAAVTLGIYLTNKTDKRTELAHAYSGRLAPVTRDPDGSIVMANAGVAGPTLEIFEDFQCPICQQFEKASGDTIKKLAADGKVKVVYRPFQLFQDGNQGANSKRAANAALCAPADKWISFHDTLYTYQPAEGTNGFSNTALKQWAQDLGFGDAASGTCVDDAQKSAQLAAMTKNALNDRKVTGTPTVFLDGKALAMSSQLMDPSGLVKAVTAIAPRTGATPQPSPSVTPATPAT